MQQLTIKRGDTFYAECQLVDEFGAGAPITGMVVSARLVDRGGNLAHTFDVTVTDAASGRFVLDSFNTANLPAALYVLQLTYTKATAVISCEACECLVVKQLLAPAIRAAQLRSAAGASRILLTSPGIVVDNSVWDVLWDATWTEG